MRISLTTKYKRGRDWYIESYMQHVSLHSIGTPTAILQATATSLANPRCRQSIGMDKAVAAAADAAFKVNSVGIVVGYPAEYTAATCKFWVDMYVEDTGTYCTGMYPHDWNIIKQLCGPAVKRLLEAKHRANITVGDITVPLFWWPTTQSQQYPTLYEYTRIHNLRTGI